MIFGVFTFLVNNLSYQKIQVATIIFGIILIPYSHYNYIICCYYLLLLFVCYYLLLLFVQIQIYVVFDGKIVGVIPNKYFKPGRYGRKSVPATFK